MYQCKTPQSTDWWDKAIRTLTVLFIPIPPVLIPQVSHPTIFDVGQGSLKQLSSQIFNYIPWDACVAMGTTEVLICRVGHQQVYTCAQPKEDIGEGLTLWGP